MTLPPEDSDFNGLDPETKFRIESLVAKPVGKLDVWFWFDGWGRELPLELYIRAIFHWSPRDDLSHYSARGDRDYFCRGVFCGFRRLQAILRQAVRFVLTKDRAGASVTPQRRNVRGGSDKLRSRPIAHAERFQPLAGTPSRGDADANPGCSGQIDGRPPNDRITLQRSVSDSSNKLRSRPIAGAKRFEPLAGAASGHAYAIPCCSGQIDCRPPSDRVSS